MAIARRSTRPRFILLLLLLTAITFVTVDTHGNSSVINGIRSTAHDAFAPISDAANSAVQPITNFFSAIWNYGDLKRENAQLRTQLQSAQGSQLQAQDLQHQLEALGQLDKLKFINDIPTVTARVIGSTGSNYEHAIQLDRGTSDGIAMDMPVVAGSGLVGHVVQVSKTQCTVLLLTDPSSSVGVRVVRTGDIGVAGNADDSGRLSVDMIGTDSSVHKGDVLTTSGLQSSLYPPDIPIGKVIDSPAPKPGDLQRDLTISLAVDFDRLSYVKVVQWSASDL